MNTGRSAVKTCLLLLPLLLGGCTRIRVKTGARIQLATIPVASIVGALPQGHGIAPGERTPLVVTFTQPDGSVFTTEGKGHGKILWRDLVVVPSLVAVNKSGVVSLGDDPRSSFGQTGHLDITVPTHTDLHATLDIPVRYDFAYVVHLSGSDGFAGSDGTGGSDGSTGSSGSFDPEHPKAGGNGGSGGNGTNGTDGGTGSDGPPVQVRMSMMSGPAPLVEIAVSSGRNAERFYLLDPVGGLLTIRTEGGRGGSAGKGGRAGRGGQGGAGSPNGSNGSDGSAGSDGSEGRSGSDGKVSVVYDPAAQPYLGLLRIASGTRSSFTESALGPLW